MCNLWAVSTRESGGLNVQPHFIGTVLAFQGTFSLCFQLLVGPGIVAKWGLIRSVQRGMMMAAFSFSAIPFVSIVTGIDSNGGGEDGEAGSLSMGFLLASVKALMSIGNYLCFTSIFCLINASVPESHLGRVNGLAMALARYGHDDPPPVLFFDFTCFFF